MEQGGVETVVLGLNRALVGAGWESAVISCGGRLAERIERDGGRHIVLDVKSKNPLTYFPRALKLRRVLAAEKPDLVCVHSRVPAWLFVWANRSLHLPWITYAHGANSVSRYSEVMTKGDLVVVPSQFLADYLTSNYAFDAKKIRVIPNAVDFERFDPAKLDRAFMDEKRREWGLEGHKVVVAVGRITPVKGFDLLVTAVPKEMKLLLVGGADRHHLDYEKRLREIAAENVVFAGNQQKIPECIALADVLVSSNTRKPESFGLTLVEALAMGVPVVAKRFGGAKEIIEDGVNGVFVFGDDDRAFAAAIEKTIAGGFAGSDMRAAAIEKFAAKKMCGQTLLAYKEALNMI